jgi:hypothetical protein
VVLLVLALAVTAVMSSAGTAFVHLSSSTEMQNTQIARNLADAALSQAVSTILQQPTFGSNAATDKITVHQAGAPASQYAYVTFDPNDASGLPWSTNNFLNDTATTATTGYTPPGQTTVSLAPGEVQLLATGVCGLNAAGKPVVTATAECVLYFPSFPWAMASGGQITSNGGTLVAGIDDFTKLYNASGQINQSALLPASMISDMAGANSTMLHGSAAAPNMITGDLQSVGTQNNTYTTVKGNDQSGAAPVPMPSITPSDYDPNGTVHPQASTQYAGGNTISGANWANAPSGGLNISGGLSMDGALLYVHGDLQISGGLTGQGAIVATGNVTINGGTALASTNLAAIIAGGNVSLTGDGTAQHGTLQGLVYAGGQIGATSITFLGPVISCGTGTGSLTTQNANMIAVPEPPVINIVQQSQGGTKGFSVNKTTYQMDVPAVPTDTVQLTLNAVPLGSGNVSLTLTGPSGPQTITAPMTASPPNFSAGQITALYYACQALNAQGHNFAFTPANYPLFQNCQSMGLSQSYATLTTIATSLVTQSVQVNQSNNATSVFSLNLDKLIDLDDRMRVLLWKDI